MDIKAFLSSCYLRRRRAIMTPPNQFTLPIFSWMLLVNDTRFAAWLISETPIVLTRIIGARELGGDRYEFAYRAEALSADVWEQCSQVLDDYILGPLWSEAIVSALEEADR